MIHVDLDYALSVVRTVVAAIMGCRVFFLCGIEAERASSKRHRIAGRILGAAFILAALMSAFFAGKQSGSVYHPCVVESFETMKMKCR